MAQRKAPRRSGAKSAANATPITPELRAKLNALYLRLHDAVDHGDAETALHEADAIKKKFPNENDPLVIEGRAALSLGLHDRAAEAFRKLTSRLPDRPELELHHGIALERVGDHEQALRQFDKVLRLDPGNFLALCHRSTTLNATGEREAAYAAFVELTQKYNGAEMSAEEAALITLTMASFAPDLVEPQIAIDALRGGLGEFEDPGFQRAAHAHLGRLLREQGEHEQAFAHYERCKAIDKGAWDPDQHSRRVDRLIDCWRDAGAVPASRSPGIKGERLVFIVGMPRSGTTLVEQMLAQYDAVVPGGEMNAIDGVIPRAEPVEMRHGPRLPLDRSLYVQKTIDSMSKAAMKAYNKVDRRAMVTDKQPYNFLLIPLIARMFPGCRFIHCVREPLDCCVSNLMTAFSQLQMHTHDQYWLGRYYADYERIMHAWQELPGLEVIDLRYEGLVRDPETQLRPVLGRLGLEWDERVLRFHESQRTVRTASRAQVRESLYTEAIGRHKPYVHLLDDLHRGLEEGRARPHGG